MMIGMSLVFVIGWNVSVWSDEVSDIVIYQKATNSWTMISNAMPTKYNIWGRPP